MPATPPEISDRLGGLLYRWPGLIQTIWASAASVLNGLLVRVAEPVFQAPNGPTLGTVTCVRASEKGSRACALYEDGK